MLGKSDRERKKQGRVRKKRKQYCTGQCFGYSIHNGKETWLVAQQAYPVGTSADGLCWAVHGYEEEEGIHLASPYLLLFLIGWSLPHGAGLPCFWLTPSWWWLVCHICNMYGVCSVPVVYCFIQAWGSWAEAETQDTWEAAEGGRGGRAWHSQGSRLLTPAGSAELVGYGNARQVRGEGPENERLPGNLERCLEGVSSPPSPSLTPLSYSFPIVLWAFKASKELCSLVQDLVYFDVCATETQSIKFWQSIRYKSVMRPLGISF